MSKRLLTLTGVTVGLIALSVIAWWLISPLFINRTVDEAFPATTSDEVAIPTEDAAIMVEASATLPVASDDSMMEPTPTDELDEPTEGAMDEEAPSEEPSIPDSSTEETMAESGDMEMEETVEAEIPVFPQTLSQGTFYPLVHAVKGTATIYLLEDGSRTLRFEDFEVDNGPDLAVWLVPNETVPNQIGTVPQGYYELAKLKGNQGNQNYEIPADLDLSLYKSVVVWCVSFSVPFAAAPLPTTTMQDDTSMEVEPENENAGAEVTTIAPTYDTIPLTVELQDLGTAPEITNNEWINTEKPLRLAELRGKVVVVEFWTFGCYNCQNVLPYIKAWDAKYEGDNFEVVSVHYPEFTYEREIENVRAAVEEAGIEYPVAIDNDGTTWRAYNQRYWPVWYVVDKTGVIRYKHIGEGGYTETEGVIQALLAE